MSAGRASGRWQGATEAGLQQLELNWVEYKVSSQPQALNPQSYLECIKRDEPDACGHPPPPSSVLNLSRALNAFDNDGCPLASPILVRLACPYTKP